MFHWITLILKDTYRHDDSQKKKKNSFSRELAQKQERNQFYNVTMCIFSLSLTSVIPCQHLSVCVIINREIALNVRSVLNSVNYTHHQRSGSQQNIMTSAYGYSSTGHINHAVTLNQKQ